MSNIQTSSTGVRDVGDVDADAVPAYLFAPAPLAVLRRVGNRITPSLDLAFGTDPELADDLVDAADEAVIAAVAEIRGAVGLWRAWRFPPGDGADAPACRVVLLEVEPDGKNEPWAADALLAGVLASSGDPTAQVEVFETHRTLSMYQATARSYSALLWAAEPGRPIAVARTFDQDDADGLGCFDADHEALPDGEDRERLLDYLDGGVVLARTDALVVDAVDPSRGSCVPLTVLTDGAWIWTATVSYYLREHGLAPDPRLVGHIGDVGGLPDRLDGVALFRATHRLQREPADASGP